MPGQGLFFWLCGVVNRLPLVLLRREFMMQPLGEEDHCKRGHKEETVMIVFRRRRMHRCLIEYINKDLTAALGSPGERFVPGCHPRYTSDLLGDASSSKQLWCIACVRLASKAGSSAKRHKAPQFFSSSQSGQGFSCGLSRPDPPVRKNNHSACSGVQDKRPNEEGCLNTSVSWMNKNRDRAP